MNRTARWTILSVVAVAILGLLGIGAWRYGMGLPLLGSTDPTTNNEPNERTSSSLVDTVDDVVSDSVASSQPTDPVSDDTHNSGTEEPSTPTNDIPDLLTRVPYEGLIHRVSLDTLLLGSEETSVIGREQLIKNFDASLAEAPSQLVSQRAAIQLALSQLTYVGGQVSLWLSSATSPVLLTKWDDELCVVFNGVASESTFNTLQLNASERASRAFEEFPLPAATRIADSLTDTPFKYVALVYCYGARSFAEEIYTNKSEEICVVFSLRDLESYNSARISQDALIRNCVVLAANASTDFEYRRIEVRPAR